MTAVELAIFMSAAVNLCGDEPPTKEQWAKIKDKVEDTAGKLIADRIFEHAEEAIKREKIAADNLKAAEAERELKKRYAAKQFAQQADRGLMNALSEASQQNARRILEGEKWEPDQIIGVASDLTYGPNRPGEYLGRPESRNLVKERLDTLLRPATAAPPAVPSAVYKGKPPSFA